MLMVLLDSIIRVMFLSFFTWIAWSIWAGDR